MIRSCPRGFDLASEFVYTSSGFRTGRSEFGSVLYGPLGVRCLEVDSESKMGWGRRAAFLLVGGLALGAGAALGLAVAPLWWLLAAIGLVFCLLARDRSAPPKEPPQDIVSDGQEPICRSVVSETRGKERGPRIVAIGGGHGLETLLRGLKQHTDDLTAIVTVADDGGSSGILRRERGILPPGDLRRCIAALADAEPLMMQLFQYRFGRGAGLDGHVFGNLFITAMAEITGNFESAISEASRVLAVRGRILPSSLDNVVLCAEVRDPVDQPGTSLLVQGQSQIAKAKGTIERVYLEPSNAKGYPEAIRALLHADLIVLGPGSLYTSILPNLLVEDIRGAFAASEALKIYVCNVATQPGETDGYTVGAHVRALAEHLGDGFCHYVLANGNTTYALSPLSRSEMVAPIWEGIEGYEFVTADLADATLPWRHDSDKLALGVMRLYQRHDAALAFSASDQDQ